MSEQPQPVTQIALVGLFVTALTTAQLTAAKLLIFDLPVSLPVTGASIILPGAAIAYALTYFASDCYTELYGKRAAQVLVNVGFLLNFALLALVWTTITAPGLDPEVSSAFAEVLAPGTNIIFGSLIAYIISQNWDVIVFHRIRARTGQRLLWLRNIGSTATSQAIDTVLFVGIAFAVAPSVLGIGEALPLAVIGALMIGQYLLKLLIALIDTPFVYLVIRLAKRADGPLRADGQPAD
jgi:uncharacterized integral membrane protein (TIGR00697 family)